MLIWSREFKLSYLLTYPFPWRNGEGKLPVALKKTQGYLHGMSKNLSFFEGGDRWRVPALCQAAAWPTTSFRGLIFNPQLVDFPTDSDNRILNYWRLLKWGRPDARCTIERHPLRTPVGAGPDLHIKRFTLQKKKLFVFCHLLGFNNSA